MVPKVAADHNCILNHSVLFNQQQVPMYLFSLEEYHPNLITFLFQLNNTLNVVLNNVDILTIFTIILELTNTNSCYEF